jgi:hypothetical protein
MKVAYVVNSHDGVTATSSCCEAMTYKKVMEALQMFAPLSEGVVCLLLFSVAVVQKVC